VGGTAGLSVLQAVRSRGRMGAAETSETWAGKTKNRKWRSVDGQDLEALRYVVHFRFCRYAIIAYSL